MGKDYSLLKPFDLEAAKAGEPIVCKEDGQPRTFVTGPDKHDYFVVETEEGWYRFGKPDDYRMAPLAWVEGKPVYKGDTLYATGGLHNGSKVEPNGSSAFGNSGCMYLPIHFGDSANVNVNLLTWDKPKTKCEGWVNVYPSEDSNYQANLGGYAYISEEVANRSQRSSRIACVKIEWEK